MIDSNWVRPKGSIDQGVQKFRLFIFVFVVYVMSNWSLGTVWNQILVVAEFELPVKSSVDWTGQDKSLGLDTNDEDFAVVRNIIDSIQTVGAIN